MARQHGTAVMGFEACSTYASTLFSPVQCKSTDSTTLGFLGGSVNRPVRSTGTLAQTLLRVLAVLSFLLECCMRNSSGAQEKYSVILIDKIAAVVMGQCVDLWSWANLGWQSHARLFVNVTIGLMS